MFWWRDPTEKTFEAVSGITIVTLDTHEATFYRVGKPIPRPCRAGAVGVLNKEAQQGNMYHNDGLRLEAGSAAEDSVQCLILLSESTTDTTSD